MANELEALIRQIVSEIEGAKGSTTQYSAPHTPSTTNTVDRVVQSKIIRLLKNIQNGLILVKVET